MKYLHIDIVNLKKGGGVHLKKSVANKLNISTTSGKKCVKFNDFQQNNCIFIKPIEKIAYLKKLVVKKLHMPMPKCKNVRFCQFLEK